MSNDLYNYIDRLVLNYLHFKLFISANLITLTLTGKQLISMLDLTNVDKCTILPFSKSYSSLSKDVCELNLIECRYKINNEHTC